MYVCMCMYVCMYVCMQDNDSTDNVHPSTKVDKVCLGDIAILARQNYDIRLVSMYVCMYVCMCVYVYECIC